jgi:hypothetical protein
VLDRIGGYNEPGVFAGFLEKALGKFPDTVKVTQTDSSAKPTRANIETGQR